MFELNGAVNSAKIFTDNCDNETISQLITLLNQEFTQGAKIRIMPDCHAGAGCVIGTTMTITDKVVPNLVGVDIGCLDADTEILTPGGWIRIADYNNEPILVYNRDTDTALFEKPQAYIKNPCDKFYHFHSQKGLDQMLSAEHKMLIWRGYKNRGYHTETELAESVFETHNAHTKSNRAIKTTFKINGTTCTDSADMIRLLVMIQADGRIRYNDAKTKSYIELHFKKQRKIDRACKLIKAAGYTHTMHCGKDNSTYISFTLDRYVTKSLKNMCGIMNDEQAQIFLDEILKWDGTVDEKRNHRVYTTTDKSNADYVQFVFATQGVRAGISVIKTGKKNWNDNYSVYATNNEYIGFPNRKFEEVPSADGYKYCFTTSTGFFIIRRNNNISITGNCGMYVAELNESEMDFAKLDEIINTRVPAGFSVRGTAHPFLHASGLNRKLQELHCIEKLTNYDRLLLSLGTLGGGNHFIEVDRNEKGNLVIVIHSGSRNLGKQVAEVYQKQAFDELNSHKAEIDEVIAALKAQHRETEIEAEIQQIKKLNVPKDLAFLQGQSFESYIHDIKIIQEFAVWNRKAMMDEILHGMGLTTVNEFTTIHNYIDTEHMILRKGSVSARAGEQLIIPINMRDGSLICTGKGNDDWNQSAPHGAGRLMSRSQAKANVSMDEFTEAMAGIYSTSVCTSTLDESPMAYKPMDEIIENVQDTVAIDQIIKPVYNFKAH